MADGMIGNQIWRDLTVKDAAELVPFYEAVCHWIASPHDMGDYTDFDMSTPSGERIAGLCHARGDNATLPPVWLMYVAVPSLKTSLENVERYGGKIIDTRGDSFAVIEDPSGAHLALWEQKA